MRWTHHQGKRKVIGYYQLIQHERDTVCHSLHEHKEQLYLPRKLTLEGESHSQAVTTAPLNVTHWEPKDSGMVE